MAIKSAWKVMMTILYRCCPSCVPPLVRSTRWRTDITSETRTGRATAQQPADSSSVGRVARLHHIESAQAAAGAAVKLVPRHEGCHNSFRSLADGVWCKTSWKRADNDGLVALVGRLATQGMKNTNQTFCKLSVKWWIPYLSILYHY